MMKSENKPTELQIKEMYSEYKQVQPGRFPKSMIATGEFVDWGTKFYQMQLELSYKSNEIEILKKKLKKAHQELYPDGGNGKVMSCTFHSFKQTFCISKQSPFSTHLNRNYSKRFSSITVAPLFMKIRPIPNSTL